MSSQLQAELTPESKNAPPVELFIDDNNPKEEQVVEQHNSRLAMFLNRDYYTAGSHDGYRYHSDETLEISKRKLKAEFQLIMDQCIQHKYVIRIQMRNMIVDVTRISENAKQKLENTISEIEASLDVLETQKELSSQSEGWIMTVIHSYQQGFIQGLSDWLDGEQLLMSIKSI
jgi:hypothetical protein